MSDETSTPAPGRPRRGPSQSDFLSGLVLTLLSLYVIVESWRMPYYEEGTRGLLSSPGLTPGLLGLGLLVLSLALMFRARGFRLRIRRPELGVETRRVLGVAAILIAYVAAIKPIGYVASTFLMLASFQLVYMERRTPGTVVGLGLGLSAAVTGLLWYVFGRVFLIPIP